MLTRLRLTEFRCFSALEFEPAPATTVIVGANAQGKTSILEAVCVLLRLQSPRSARLADLVRSEAAGFAVGGSFSGRSLQVRYAEGRRSQSCEGKPLARGADYLAESGCVVWMGSDDRQLVRGSSAWRRRYLDFVGCQLYPAYRTALLRYERVLRARNALLRAQPRPDWAGIAAHDPILVREGDVITRLRGELCAVLAGLVPEAHAAIAGPAEQLDLAYRPAVEGGDFEGVLRRIREVDAARRQTTRGPHRDDFELALGGRPAGVFASEGQQRTLALALKLAQAALLADASGAAPLILIDDVFGELDRDRRKALLAALPQAGQRVLTTTNLEWLPDFRDIEPAICRLEDGGFR